MLVHWLRGDLGARKKPRCMVHLNKQITRLPGNLLGFTLLGFLVCKPRVYTYVSI